MATSQGVPELLGGVDDFTDNMHQRAIFNHYLSEVKNGLLYKTRIKKARGVLSPMKEAPLGGEPLILSRQLLPTTF